MCRSLNSTEVLSSSLSLTHCESAFSNTIYLQVLHCKILHCPGLIPSALKKKASQYSVFFIEVPLVFYKERRQDGPRGIQYTKFFLSKMLLLLTLIVLTISTAMHDRVVLEDTSIVSPQTQSHLVAEFAFQFECPGR